MLLSKILTRGPARWTSAERSMCWKILRKKLFKIDLQVALPYSPYGLRRCSVEGKEGFNWIEKWKLFCIGTGLEVMKDTLKLF